MELDNDLIQNSIADLGISEHEYYSLQSKVYRNPDYTTTIVVSKDAFFDWCKYNALECYNGSVYARVRGMQDSGLKCGEYEYGPTVNTVMFSYSS